METVISIADLQSIYSVDDMDGALGDSAARRNEVLKSWYDRMRELGGRAISSSRRPRLQSTNSARSRPISSMSSTIMTVWPSPRGNSVARYV
jgi:hypothetical protein